MVAHYVDPPTTPRCSLRPVSAPPIPGPFAAQSALAIQHARLYAETKRREWEATKLYEVSTQLASSLDADGVLDLITAETIGLLGCDASGLFTELPEDLRLDVLRCPAE